MVLLSGNFRRLKVDVSRLCCCQIRFGTKYKPKFDTNQNLRIPLARFKTFTVLCPDYFSSIIIYCGHFIKHKLLIFEEWHYLLIYFFDEEPHHWWELEFIFGSDTNNYILSSLKRELKRSRTAKKLYSIKKLLLLSLNEI